MRRIAPFLLILCAALVAESRAPERIPGPLFQGDGEEDEGSGEGAAEEPDLSPPDDAAETQIEDKLGNYTLTLPKGWLQTQEIPEDEDSVFRFAARRSIQDGSEVSELEIWRFTTTRAETFTVDTPSDVLDQIETNIGGWIEQYFGDGSKGVMQPEMDEGTLLGDADKSGEFTYRGRTMKERLAIEEAEKQIRRGTKGVTLPEYPERELRGRIAMVSPNIYLMRVFLRPGLADNETLNAEATAVMDSFKFIVEGALPAPLRVAGERIKDTTKDEANKEDRKEAVVHSVSGRKVWSLQLKYLVPAGMAILDKEKRGADASIILYAQDERNNWVKVVIAHMNHNQLSEQRKKPQDPRGVCNSWRSNYESKLRGAKFPSKPQSVKLGPFSGKGFKMLKGKAEGFPGTFQGVVSDKSGWRTTVTVDTRGDPKAFEKSLKKFFKSLKIKYK